METSKKERDIVVVLDNVRSVHNVGSVFRTSDALGVSEIFLCGITPAPVDRFGRDRDDLHKAALGAEKTVAWKQCTSTLECVSKLKQDGYTVIAIEQDERSVDYKNVSPSQKTAFIFGNEVDGVSKDVLEQCDVVAEIPMMGGKESLNISVSFGVAMFRMLDN
jgi:23S rRNA (guanosine2251-2'-O)-methyltransferase